MEYEDATYAVVESNTPFGVDITYTFDPFTNTLTTAWDFAGLELDGTNPDVVITSDRDSNGFLLWEQASVAGTADYRNDYQFDGYGRPVAVKQDAVTGGNSVAKKRVEFSYNDDSYLAAIDRYLYETDGTTLDPVASSSYSYTDGELTGLVHSDPADAVLREYDWTYQAGRIVGETVDDDTRAFTYDAEGQLKTVTAVPPGGSTPVETEFVYDATGNRQEIKEDNVQVADYTVDAFNRVTFDGTYHYQYDPEGNRTAKFVDGTPANGTLDSGDTDWTEYTWDNRNRLIQVESGATYGTTDVTVAFGYDWLNRWISTDVDYASADDTAEYFVYGVATLPDEVAPWDRAATDLRDVGQITLRLDDTEKITNRYLWGPAVDQILADEQVEWNAVAEDYDIDQILWPLTDHQGTTRDLAKVNATSGDTEIVNTRSYDAYGILLAETAPAVDHLFGFTARITQTDAGLVNCLNRWYDPEVGTWLNEDLIGFEGGDANLYRYCGNDPVNSVDPSGLIIETIWDVGMLAWDIGCAVKNTVETTYHGAATGVHWARGDAEAQAESWKKTKENARELAWNAVDLGVDAASTALPGVPAGGSKAARAVAKGGKEVLEQAPGALNKAKKGADAAKEVAEKVKKGKKGGGRPGHTPGKGHVGKSGPEKTKKFQKKAKKLRDQAQARYDEAVARWEKMSEAARKLRPELHPDNFRP